MKRKSLTNAQRLSNVSGIPIDAVTKSPYIRLCSNREIMVEDAGKLLHYDKTLIKIRQNKLVVAIEGRDLEVRCLANSDLRVTGFLEKIYFE